MSELQPSLIRRWPDPETGPLELRLWFGIVDGHPAVTRVDLSGLDADAAIRAADIRLPLGAFLDKHVEEQQSRGNASKKLYGDSPAVKELVKLYGSKKGRGRPSKKPDEFYEHVASIYQRAVREGDRKPAERVADELGDPSPTTARVWIYRARKRGFIPPYGKRDKEVES